MSFVQPLYLVGLLAAAIPVIIHLINRRQAVRQEFPAITLLMESDKKEARSIKVRRWLLMALRVLAIALLAMALAKPFFLTDVQGAETSRYPSAVVFVLDDTMSMRFERDGGESWFARAKSRIRQQLDELKPWDEVSLITATETDAPVSRLVDSRSRIRRALKDVAPSQQTANLPNALAAAADIASTSELPNRRIVLVSDFAAGGFPEPPVATEGDAEGNGAESDDNGGPSIPYPVDRVDVREADEEAPSNLVVEEVNYRQVGPPRKGEFEISSHVRNVGPEGVSDIQVQLIVEGQPMATRTVDIEGGSATPVTMRHRVSGSGVKRARLALPDADGLAPDSRRYFTLYLQRKVDVLMVNGAPSSVPYRDELFFAVRALKPSSESTSNIVPTTITRDGLAEKDLSKFDVILLANVSKIPPKTGDRLTGFVKDGGGLFLAMGDQVETESYNSQLEKLLPKPLRRTKLLARRDDPDAPLKVTHIGASSREHPVFSIFDLPGGASLREASIYRYMLLNPVPADDRASVLLSYKDGGPALLERRLGRGRVFLLTTTIDRGWTDLPLRTTFLPLMRRSMLYLARRTTSEDQTRYLVGQDVQLDVSGLVEQQAIVRGPMGETAAGPDGPSRWVLPLVEEGAVSLTPTEAGVYEVWADEIIESPESSSSADAGRRLEGLSFAVNVDHAESDLAPLPDNAYTPWLAGADGEQARTGDAGPKRRVNLWPTILFCVAIALLLETLIGTRRSVLKRLWRRATFQGEREVEV